MKLSDYEDYVKKYKKSIPPFYNSKVQMIDIYPILSYFKIVSSAGMHPELVKLHQTWYCDIDTGYVTHIVDRYAHKRYKKFYYGIFQNKRRGKRYVFALDGQNKPILCAILTHISAIRDRHSKTTMKYLVKARSPIYKNKADHNILDIWTIDKFVFAVVGTKQYAQRAKIFWHKAYKAAFMLKRYIK